MANKLAKELKVDTLLVAGSKASYVHTVHTMHQNMNKEKTQLLKIEKVGDVIAEAVSCLCLPNK